MDRYRVRIRFRKEGDLRLTSHRDLVRVFERMFRRAEMRLRMSEGFHPKPRMTFPSALSLGIAGLGEWMEVELAEAADLVELRQRLTALAPPGLTILDMRMLAPGEAKGRVIRFHYAIEVPEPRQESTRQAVTDLMSSTTRTIERSGRATPVDVRGGIEALEMRDGHLHMALHASSDTSVRPREVLAVLGLDDLESNGGVIRRTDVELAT